jgi:hypothetical protein
VTEVCIPSFRSSVMWGLALIVVFLKFPPIEESHGFKSGDRGHHSEPPPRTWYLFPNVSFESAHGMDHMKPCDILLELVLTDTDTVTDEKRIKVMNVLMGDQHDLSTTEVYCVFLLSA